MQITTDNGEVVDTKYIVRIYDVPNEYYGPRNIVMLELTTGSRVMLTREPGCMAAAYYHLLKHE